MNIWIALVREMFSLHTQNSEFFPARKLFFPLAFVTTKLLVESLLPVPPGALGKQETFTRRSQLPVQLDFHQRAGHYECWGHISCPL